MKKFRVEIPCEVQGYLIDGHYEGEVEVENEEQLKELIDSGEITDYLNFELGSYEVEDIEIEDEYASYEEI